VLLGFHDPVKSGKFPYAPSWHAHSALNVSLKLLKDEGFDNVIEWHRAVAGFTRADLKRLGLKLYTARDELSAPTVTVVFIPEN
jgi:pyridoxamine--pyruvate transaminase